MMELNLNRKAYALIKKLQGLEWVDAKEYDIEGGSAIVLDLGVDAKIDEEAGKEIGSIVAQASMGTLGTVWIKDDILHAEIPKHPSIAALECQMAGWRIMVEGKSALGSGPARILAKKPKNMQDSIGYTETAKESALILETGTLPGLEICRKILGETGTENLIIAAFRDDTAVGLINVLARIAEVGIYRLQKIGYDVNRIVSAKGTVPVPKLDKDIMYSSNDAIIYGGTVSLKVKGWIPELTASAVSKFSPYYGRPFKEIYQKAGGDFYKIDPQIFAPARLEILDLEDNRKYSAGEINL